MQAIQTRYHGPSNTRGSRISAKADAGRISIPYPHELSGEACHRAAAEALCKKLGWDDAEKLVGGQLPNGDYAFVFPGRGF
jgi:hypothetical protein